MPGGRQTCRRLGQQLIDGVEGELLDAGDRVTVDGWAPGRTPVAVMEAVPHVPVEPDDVPVQPVRQMHGLVAEPVHL
jgi:hypothetical protein